MIAIINYQAGNLASVKKAINDLGFKACVTSNPKTILRASKVIFPGVGQAKTAMKNLGQLGLVAPIKQYIESGKPFLGICLGAQILFDKSEEGNTKCLGIIPGQVKKFKGKNLVVPHMGWNEVEIKKQNKSRTFLRGIRPCRKVRDKLFKGITDKSFFYFVHSYYLEPKDKRVVLGVTDYGKKFASVINQNNLWAVQFHLEKSGPKGLKMLNNFLRLC